MLARRNESLEVTRVRVDLIGADHAPPVRVVHRRVDLQQVAEVERALERAFRPDEVVDRRRGVILV